MNDRLEISVWLFRSLAGKDDFLRRGFIWACLKLEGNTQELSEKCTILVAGPNSVRRQDFSRNLGI